MLTGHDQFVGAVVVVVFKEGRVLGLRRAPTKDAGAGLWECVSGRIEVDEAPFDAACRETTEETGLDVTLEERPIDAYTARRGEAPMLVVCYRADWNGGEVTRSDEHDAHEWLTPAGFAERTTWTRLAEAVHAAGRASRGAFDRG